jgi:hypothetical protein
MKLRAYMLVFAALAFSALAFGQYAVDDPTQVHYFSNLGMLATGGVGDAFIHITNTGASGGNICVNVYTFAPDEEEISCCTCPVTPNGLVSLDVGSDLIGNTLTPAVPTSVTVKLVATNQASCNAAAQVSLSKLVPGMRAWGTNLHAAPTSPVTFQITETPVLTADIAANPGATDISAELKSDIQLCKFIGILGSGYGICGSCRLGGLGAQHQ